MKTNVQALEDLLPFLQTLRDGVVFVNQRHVVTYANLSALRSLGHTRSSLFGKNFEEASNLQANGAKVDGSTSPLTICQKKNAIYSTDSSPDVEYSMGRNDRSLFNVRLSVIPSEEGFTVVFHDKTADEKIDQAKSEFISLVSHQLRTPVNIISWYVEKLTDVKHGDLSRKQREYLEEIDKGNHRLISLVQAIVNVSRTDLNRLKHKHEQIDLLKILHKVVDELSIMSSGKSLQLTLSFQNGDYNLLDSDAELVAFVFKAILNNAISYTPKEGSISVQTEYKKVGNSLGHANDKAPDDGWLLTISDDGIGIPDEDKARVFERLYRGSNVQALDITGIGLSLYIAQNFMSELGGMIWFTSDLRKGTTFYVFIPKTTGII